MSKKYRGEIQEQKVESAWNELEGVTGENLVLYQFQTVTEAEGIWRHRGV